MEFSDEYVPLVLNEFAGGKLDITDILKKYWWAILVAVLIAVIYYKNNESANSGTSLSVEIVNGEEKIVKKEVLGQKLLGLLRHERAIFY